MKIEEYREITKKRSKYGNQKTIYQGEMYDSAGEAKWAEFLDGCRKAVSLSDRVLSYKRQVPYGFFVDGKKIFTYIADFVVLYADEHIEIQDFKGMRTDIFKLKKKIIEASQRIKIREVTIADLPR